jgi:hypothetical protein
MNTFYGVSSQLRKLTILESALRVLWRSKTSNGWGISCGGGNVLVLTGLDVLQKAVV